MDKPQLNLTSLLVYSAALPIWIYMSFMIPYTPAFGPGPHRYIMTPIVLGVITMAIHRLIREKENAWAYSVLGAAVLSLGSLLLAAGIAAGR